MTPSDDTFEGAIYADVHGDLPPAYPRPWTSKHDRSATLGQVFTRQRGALVGVSPLHGVPQEPRYPKHGTWCVSSRMPWTGAIYSNWHRGPR